MDVHAAKPAGTAPMSDLEWQMRVDLAACYRLVDHFGMWTCISITFRRACRATKSTS